MSTIALDTLPVGKAGIVDDIELGGVMRRRLQDLGLIVGTKIEPTKKSSKKGPTAYRIRESIYALRQDDASHISVTVG